MAAKIQALNNQQQKYIMDKFDAKAKDMLEALAKSLPTIPYRSASYKVTLTLPVEVQFYGNQERICFRMDENDSYYGSNYQTVRVSTNDDLTERKKLIELAKAKLPAKQRKVVDAMADNEKKIDELQAKLKKARLTLREKMLFAPASLESVEALLAEAFAGLK